MGFLGIIPANKLAALYDTKQQKLILYAEGVVKGATYGFNFRRDPFVGGLKFTLMAWTGPLTGKDQPYSFNQAFAIHLPQPHFSSGSVLIVTANHPEGELVPIHYTGYVPPHTDLVAASAADTAKVPADAAVTTTSPNDTKLNVLFKEPFNITAGARVPEFGSVDIQYDKTMLEMVTAEISNTNIVWTFNSLQTGDTQIVVTTHGGIATYIMVQNYDVRIFVL